MAKQSICLCMIVKNEAPVIRRCLDSVRAVIDHWIIVDTGSTDGTQEIIRDHLRELPGELHERPWRDFAHNRTEALELARNRADYTLIIDADDALEIQPGLSVQALTADSYTLDIHDTSINYQRTQLVRSALPWQYEGVLHEYLTCDGAGPAGHLDGVVMRRNHDGARRKDPETYRRDARLLEAALADNPTDFLRSRYTFYLAQSYRDCGEKQKALEHYLKRAELGFWQEEVFVALYEAAKIIEGEGRVEQEVIDAYLRASDALPTRVEALHGASRFCRYKGRNEEGYQIAKRGLEIPVQTDALFLETWIYDTGLLDEYAINGYWSGHYQDCLSASLKMLATGKTPAQDIQRVVANAKFASERLPIAREPNLGDFDRPDFFEQHSLRAPRTLHGAFCGKPRVLVAILAKQKEQSLPLYLQCIESLDYPKSEIVLYIRTNNNTDGTEQILRAWILRVQHLYAAVEFNTSDVADRVEQFKVHEWNATRFRVLSEIRNYSLKLTKTYACKFYFVVDVDNFVRPNTLSELLKLNLPIVAPLLRSIGAGAFYSNFHAAVDSNGYYQDCDQYQWIINRWIVGVLEVPVVHCTYLIRANMLDSLTYSDGGERHEYVIFSDVARKAGIPQYLDNRQIYGYLTFDESNHQFVVGGIQEARRLIQENSTDSQLDDYAEPVSNDSGIYAQENSSKNYTYDGSSIRIGNELLSKAENFLPEMHVINLDRDVARYRSFCERNSHLSAVNRFSAIDGLRLNRDQLIETGYIADDLSYPDGTLGCAMSHIRLWELSVAKNRSITVFEDDILVSADFEMHVGSLLSATTDEWEFIQWGSIINPSFTWIDLGTSKVRLQGYGPRRYAGPDTWSMFQVEKKVPGLVKLLHSFGMQGYSISPKGARSALDFVLPLRSRFITFNDADVTTKDEGIDITLCGLYPKISAFLCVPPIVTQCDGMTSTRVQTDMSVGRSEQ